MGKFRLVQGLGEQVLEHVKEAYDLTDVKHDLERIEKAVYNNHWPYAEAESLDREMRRKYPTINAMVQLVNVLSTLPPYQNSVGKTNVVPYTEDLNLDYFGIICDVAIKKGIKETIEDCILYIG